MALETDRRAIDLPPIQEGRAAWRGEDLAVRDDWILSLCRSHVEELEAAASSFVAHREAGANQLIGLTPEKFPLSTFGSVLVSLRAELLTGRGFVLIRGLPIDRYSRLQAAAILLGIGAHIGNARSQNAKGHVLGHVFDLGLSGADPNVRIYQTSQRQTFHTDSCDVVGLLCVREARRGGESLLVSALSIYNVLRREAPDLLARLLRPMPHDRRGETPVGMKPYFDIPVFSWHHQLLTVFYQRQYFDSAQRFENARRLTSLDVQALDRFDSIANDTALTLTMRLQPGDLQFVHNHNVLHDRTGFEDWPEPSRKRHLLRLWLACPGARPLPPAFAARYGSLEIGNRGGVAVPGMRLSVPLDAE
jgi:hypothetical protein